MTTLAWIAFSFVLVLAALAVTSLVAAGFIEARFPPLGRFIDVDGVRLHVLDVPAGTDDGGPPLVLLHGASGNLNDLRLALESRLHARHRLVFIDRPGHGWSDRPSRDLAAPAAQARLVARVIEVLGIDRAVILGHSLGGAVAAAFAVAYPGRMAGLVFLAPATHPWPGGVAWNYRAALTPVLGPLMAWTIGWPASELLAPAAIEGVFAPNPVPAGYSDAAAIPLVFRPKAFLANAQDVASLKANVTAMAPRYREITAPTVIVTGDKDSVVWPSIHSEGLRHDIAGAELIVLPGVGHMPHHSATDAVVRAIEGLMARVARRPQPAG